MGQRFQMYIHTVNPYDEFILKDQSYYPGDQENNQKVTEAFSPFELLTIAEVKAIFPAMAATIDKHNKPGKSSTNGSK